MPRLWPEDRRRRLAVRGKPAESLRRQGRGDDALVSRPVRRLPPAGTVARGPSSTTAEPCSTTATCSNAEAAARPRASSRCRASAQGGTRDLGPGDVSRLQGHDRLEKDRWRIALVFYQDGRFVPRPGSSTCPARRAISRDRRTCCRASGTSRRPSPRRTSRRFDELLALAARSQAVSVSHERSHGVDEHVAANVDVVEQNTYSSIPSADRRPRGRRVLDGMPRLGHESPRRSRTSRPTAAPGRPRASDGRARASCTADGSRLRSHTAGRRAP